MGRGLVAGLHIVGGPGLQPDGKLAFAVVEEAVAEAMAPPGRA